MPTQQSITIDRLHSLKPGEKFVYYKGNFKKDIGASEARAGILLAEIQEAAERLKAAGKVYLVHKKVEKKVRGETVAYIEYAAIGAS